MRFFRYGLLIVATIGLIGSLGYIVYAPASPGEASGLTAFDLEGDAVSFDDFAGDVLIVDFWATWCAPCITEIPHYNSLEADYRGKGVHLIGVTLQSGTVEEVVGFANDPEHPITYPLVMGNDALINAYGPVIGLPTTLLFDQEGNLVKRWFGASPNKSEELRQMIDALLAGEEVS